MKNEDYKLLKKEFKAQKKEYKNSKKYFCDKKEILLDKIYHAIYDECSRPLNEINENVLNALLETGKYIGGKNFDSSKILQTLISQYKTKRTLEILTNIKVERNKGKDNYEF